MADFNDLNQRSASQLQNGDEAVVQPNGNVAPERTELGSLRTFILNRLQIDRDQIDPTLITEIESNRLSVAGLTTRFENAKVWQTNTVSSASGYNAILNAQLGQASPLILVFTAAISGIRGGVRYTYEAGQVSYVPFADDTVLNLFVLPQPSTSGAGGLNQAQVDARVQAGVLDWAESGNRDVVPLNKIHSDIARDSEVSAAVGAEATLRTNADTALGTRIDTETTNRTSADSALGTRIDGVNTTAGTALARTQRLRPIGLWRRGAGAQNILLEWKPVGAVANGAAIAVSIAGANIAGVTAPEGLAASDTNGTVLTIAVNAANAGTIDRTSNTIAGHIEIQITYSGNTDTTWMGVDPAAEEVNNARDGTVNLKIWQGTEAQYTAITNKDANTLYFTT